MDFNHTCLAVNTLDFALTKDENYYLQLFLKECKYIEKKVIWHINDNLINFLMILMKNSYQVNAFRERNFDNVFLRAQVGKFLFEREKERDRKQF